MPPVTEAESDIEKENNLTLIKEYSGLLYKEHMPLLMLQELESENNTINGAKSNTMYNLPNPSL